MRVFWWNGGVHAEPENDVETEALLVLLHGLKIEGPPNNIGGPHATDGVNVRDLGQGEGGLDVGH